MTLMVHWIVALTVGAVGGLFIGILIACRRMAKKDRALVQAMNDECLMRERTMGLREKSKLLREIAVLHGQRQEQAEEFVRLQASMIETRDAELRELRTTVVGVAAMRDRLSEWEALGLDLHVGLQENLSDARTQSRLMLLRDRLTGLLVPVVRERLSITSLEEVSPGDEETRPSEEPEAVQAEAR